MKEAAQPYDSDARSVMNEQKKKKKDRNAGSWEQLEDGEPATALCTGATIYNIKQPVMVTTRPVGRGRNDRLWEMT